MTFSTCQSCSTKNTRRRSSSSASALLLRLYSQAVIGTWVKSYRPCPRSAKRYRSLVCRFTWRWFWPFCRSGSRLRTNQLTRATKTTNKRNNTIREIRTNSKQSLPVSKISSLTVFWATSEDTRENLMCACSTKSLKKSCSYVTRWSSKLSL